MGKNYGLIAPRRIVPPGVALPSLFARFEAAASRDGGRWLLVQEDRGNAGASRIFRMRLAGDGVSVPDFSPGQYVFLSFPGRGVLSSPRAFTIASPPSEGRWLELYAKDGGEWSGRAKLLAASRSDAPIRARISGPFGRFSYLSARGTGRFVFLAAGMGGAPFLSMLRFMADEDRDCRVFFLWGGLTREDIFAASELERAAERVKGLRFLPLFSHDPLWTGERGRIDGEKIERFVPAFFGSTPLDFEWNSASYWLCGPPQFRRDLKKALRDRSVHRAAIHEESFGV